MSITASRCEARSGRTFTTILSPSGDHHAAKFSPCSRMEVGVLDRYARAAAGCNDKAVYFQRAPEGTMRPRTLTTHTAIPFLVTRQNKDLRGLGTSAMTFSGGRLGRAGMDASCRAAAIGKYMASREENGVLCVV